ncbi:hypothetical protein B0T18DRAFT_438495 [Schizothecium vesticola]|uniref:NADPH-dependent diflavin oxidoreductase 1 n=1 Tax=Schizothecium vesticola TaxID=314040 RepID=A0AA40K5C9_9PEZI|nr:hypothetical protein B0T18DRAFT_438495 [Schizothecium vesticola]
MTATLSGKQVIRTSVTENRTMIILYGSETGNAEEIAMALGKMAERLHFQTRVDEMDSFKLADLLKASLVIFVTSTTGQGDMPKNTTRFWRNLRREKLNNTNCLRRLTFALFGLGDSSYPKFNWAARKLRARLLQLGAAEFFRTGEADERHENGIDSVYLPWSQDLKLTILNQKPLPEGLQPIPEEEQLPPKHLLRLAATRDPKFPPSDRASVEEPRSLAIRANSAVLPRVDGPRSVPGDQDDALKDASESHLLKSLSHKPAAFPPDDLLDIPGTLMAEVLKNERMTPEAHWQDVRHLVLQVSCREGLSLDEAAGSTAIIWPKNYPEDVQTLIDMMEWGEIADKVLDLDAEILSRKSNLHLFSRSETLRDLLTHNFDINSVPKRSFIEDLAFFTKEPMEIERLRELTQSGNEQEYYDYTSRPRRTIIELLRDFPGVKIPFQHALDLFPLIRGREFSLANGNITTPNPPEAATTPDKPHLLKLELIIALLEYRTIIRKPRSGLCSRYIQNLPPGTRLTIGIKTPSKPILTTTNHESSRPLIAVATGTGIAPIRALIQSRAAMAKQDTSTPGPTKLFFGCRSRAADFFFADEWPTYPALDVHAAFSRDPFSPPAIDIDAPHQYDTGKNYVQHQIREHGREVAALLRGGKAIICVCGNAGRMPVSVREAFKEVLVRYGVVADAGEAEGWLGDGGRVTYWQETW